MAFEFTPFIHPVSRAPGSTLVADEAGAHRAALDITRLKDELDQARAMYPIQLNVAKMKSEAMELELNAARVNNSIEMLELNKQTQIAQMEEQKQQILDARAEREAVKMFNSEFGNEMATAVATQDGDTLFSILQRMESNPSYAKHMPALLNIWSGYKSRLSEADQLASRNRYLAGDTQRKTASAEMERVSKIVNEEGAVADVLGVRIDEVSLKHPDKMVTAIKKFADSQIARSDLTPDEKKKYEHLSADPDIRAAKKGKWMQFAEQTWDQTVQMLPVLGIIGKKPERIDTSDNALMEAAAIKNDFVKIGRLIDSPKTRAEGIRIMREYVTRRSGLTDVGQSEDVKKLTPETQALVKSTMAMMNKVQQQTALSPFGVSADQARMAGLQLKEKELASREKIAAMKVPRNVQTVTIDKDGNKKIVNRNYSDLEVGEPYVDEQGIPRKKVSE